MQGEGIRMRDEGFRGKGWVRNEGGWMKGER